MTRPVAEVHEPVVLVVDGSAPGGERDEDGGLDLHVDGEGLRGEPAAR